MAFAFTNEEEIVTAINKAGNGIAQYLSIMSLYPTVDVSSDLAFQKKFNGFYRVQRRPAAWYKEYYASMERWKAASPSFDEVLDHLNSRLGRYEPSFSSKLIATLDPRQPIWDEFVLTNTGTLMPSYASKSKMAQAKSAYKSIQDWYMHFLDSENGRQVVRIFKQVVPDHNRITDLKKVDFVLWQTRPDKKKLSELSLV